MATPLDVYLGSLLPCSNSTTCSSLLEETLQNADQERLSPPSTLPGPALCFLPPHLLAGEQGPSLVAPEDGLLQKDTATTSVNDRHTVGSGRTVWGEVFSLPSGPLSHGHDSQLRRAWGKASELGGGSVGRRVEVHGV